MLRRPLTLFCIHFEIVQHATGYRPLAVTFIHYSQFQVLVTHTQILTTALRVMRSLIVAGSIVRTVMRSRFE